MIGDSGRDRGQVHHTGEGKFKEEGRPHLPLSEFGRQKGWYKLKSLAAKEPKEDTEGLCSPYETERQGHCGERGRQKGRFKGRGEIRTGY